MRHSILDINKLSFSSYKHLTQQHFALQNFDSITDIEYGDDG
jgi:hypothetical protein